MSPLTIARIEAELITLAVELKARDPDMTPAKLQALRKWLRRWDSPGDRHDLALAWKKEPWTRVPVT